VLLDPDALEIVALSAAGVSVIAVGFSAAMVVRVRRLTAAHDVLTGGDATASFVESVTRQHREVEGMRTDVGHLREDLAAARADLSDALRHVAVVRYDAFGDMGGRLSFSAALLDDAGDGLVLTSINGRSETRTYAKGVKAGDSDHSLSPEEQQAISYATRAVVQPREVEEPEQVKRSRFSRR
jgi:hypothetical protein